MTGLAARLGGIERSFGSVRALEGADLALRYGEVHGVLGANGAGKSTLLNILGGMLRPDDGVIEIDGDLVSLAGPRDAWRLGIGLVHQHFTLVPALSVAENLALGVRGRPADAFRSDVERLMTRTGLDVPMRPRVEELGVGDRQRIEILKVLLRDPRVLILDEPTAVLTPDEVDGLFALLRDLADDGRAVALVAHKLDEVLGVADRITVLRDGRTVLTGPRGEHGIDVVVEAMVGTEPVDPIAVGLGDAGEGEPRAGARPEAEPVVRLEGVGVDVDGRAAVIGVDLDVRPGEVVGIAGVEGNGQHELALVLADRRAPDRGTAVLPSGIGFIPQDRNTEGTIASFDLAENLALASHRQPDFVDGRRLRWDRIRSAAEAMRVRFDVDAVDVSVQAGTLSGGNRQRIVVGREIAMATELLVAENPTRGLDITASAFVHDELRRLRETGVAIVLISTDLDEILGLSDRVCAIARGRLTELPGDVRTREEIGARMLSADGHA